ncbi:hypothetical protein YC2023_067167 [Brassica napus]|nr:unnamed protein product [Brassica napus]
MSSLFILSFSSNETTNGFVQYNLPEKMSGIQGHILEVTVVGFQKLKDTKWLSRQDLYVFLEYNETLTSYRRNSSSWWSSCSESAVAAGQSLRRRFRCREKPREATMVNSLYFTYLVL